MPKMSLERFREIKNRTSELLDLINKIDNEEITLTEDEEQTIQEDFEQLNDEIHSSDLSDIPFEEYEGFHDLDFNFEGTGANIDFNIIDLQEEYQKVTGKSSYPQAAIFVKDELVDSGNLQFLDEMKNDINSCNLDTSLTAQNAINYIDTFSNMSEDVLKSAILGSNIRVEEDINVDKEAIDFYLTQLENLDLNTYGEKPQEDFYIC